MYTTGITGEDHDRIKAGGLSVVSGLEITGPDQIDDSTVSISFVSGVVANEYLVRLERDVNGQRTVAVSTGWFVDSSEIAQEIGQVGLQRQRTFAQVNRTFDEYFATVMARFTDGPEISVTKRIPVVRVNDPSLSQWNDALRWDDTKTWEE